MEYIAVNGTYNCIFTTNSAAGAAVAPSGAFGTDDIVLTSVYADDSIHGGKCDNSVLRLRD